MDGEDDGPKKRHAASDVPPDDGRLGRATAWVYVLAAIAIAVGVAAALLAV